jgi:hypothetical protein
VRIVAGETRPAERVPVRDRRTDLRGAPAQFPQASIT